MTEYELDCATKAFERALEVGAPGLAESLRLAIVRSASLKLRHQFNIPNDGSVAPMTDIVERLRQSHQYSGIQCKGCLAAADEIDRLRRLLAEARQYVKDAGDDEDPETQQHSLALLAEIGR